MATLPGGRLIALAGGVPGVISGAWLFAEAYSNLEVAVSAWWDLGELAFSQLARKAPWMIVLPASIDLTGLPFLLERAGM